MRALATIGTLAFLVSAPGCGDSDTPAQTLPTVHSIQGQPLTGTFNLNFIGFFESEHESTTTEHELEIDTAKGTARLVKYHEEVSSILLPGDIETGAIVIEVTPGSSVGTYDQASARFSTEEEYVIRFEHDLSAYGFESPVRFVANNQGRIQWMPATEPRVQHDWRDQVTLNNPAVGDIECEFGGITDGELRPTPDTLIALGLSPALDGVELTDANRKLLEGQVTMARQALARSDVQEAGEHLDDFAAKCVELMAVEAAKQARDVKAVIQEGP